MEQPTLTDAEITAALQTHYVPTKYGRKIGIKRISSTAFQECQFLFAPPVREEAGWVDPMKIGFQDVPCTACGALRGNDASSPARVTGGGPRCASRRDEQFTEGRDGLLRGEQHGGG